MAPSSIVMAYVLPTCVVMLCVLAGSEARTRVSVFVAGMGAGAAAAVILAVFAYNIAHVVSQMCN